MTTLMRSTCRYMILWISALVAFGCVSKTDSANAITSANQLKPMTDAERLAALQLSERCAEAGKRYARDETQHAQLTVLGSHYNRTLNRCLVEVQTSVLLPHSRSDATSILDPIEHVDFALYATTSDIKDTTVDRCIIHDASGTEIDCGKDKHLVNVAWGDYQRYRENLMNK